jgi:hypothetical protein
MKKTLSIILAASLVILLAATLLPATPVFAREATHFELVGTQYSFANGLVLIFATDGNVKGANTTVEVTINGKQVSLDCVVKNEEHQVVCHTAKDLGLSGGEEGTVNAFGQTFHFAAPKILVNEPSESTTSTINGICPSGELMHYVLKITFSTGSSLKLDGYFSDMSAVDAWVQQKTGDGWNFPVVDHQLEFVECVNK